MMKMQRVFSIVLTLLILTITLEANEHYLLPEDKSNLMRTLKLKLERAKSITIITQKLASNTLSRSIEKSLRKKATLLLITTDLDSAAYYAKYKNTLVKVPTSQRLALSFQLNILLIDESNICFSSLPFDDALLRRETGQVICTTDAEEIRFGESIKEKFLQRFETY